VDVAATLAEARSLSIDDRLRLVEGLWESIIADSDQLEVTAEEREFIEQRLAAHLAHPDDVVSWEVVKARALARIRR
jgi:putative addiction module component (TIGR02574 family)